jgi:polyhydroxybutyrate depolymerase
MTAANGWRRRWLPALLLVFAALFYLLRLEMVAEPVLPGEIRQGQLEWDGRVRTFSWYQPDRRALTPALVFVLHGSMGDGDMARASFAYEFERLAEQHGFIPVFPDGFEGHFNDCRKAGPYSANELEIDDVGFLSAVVDSLATSANADASRVYATGLSNGGNMALRLGLEMPGLFRAVAPVATALPLDDNLDCTKSGKAVALLLMNGTADPMNPYQGGTVALYGLFGNRGEVLSSQDTVAYFANLAGHKQPPTQRELPDRNTDDAGTVLVTEWLAPAKPPVALYTVTGGGHAAPHPHMSLPKLLGGSNHDFIAAEAIWEFFQSSQY